MLDTKKMRRRIVIIIKENETLSVVKALIHLVIFLKEGIGYYQASSSKSSAAGYLDNLLEYDLSDELMHTNLIELNHSLLPKIAPDKESIEIMLCINQLLQKKKFMIIEKKSCLKLVDENGKNIFLIKVKPKLINSEYVKHIKQLIMFVDERDGIIVDLVLQNKNLKSFEITSIHAGMALLTLRSIHHTNWLQIGESDDEFFE